MASKNTFKVKSETLLIIVGFLLLIIAILLFHYQKFLEVVDELYNNIQAEIYKENTTSALEVNIDVDYVEQDIDNKEEAGATPNYIGFLEIDKINLRQGLLPKKSYYNYVDYHVQIMDISDFPDKVGGNFILAGHSGTSNVAFFRNLYKLKIGDVAKVYYQSKLYKYSIVNIYKQVKE